MIRTIEVHAENNCTPHVIFQPGGPKWVVLWGDELQGAITGYKPIMATHLDPKGNTKRQIEEACLLGCYYRYEAVEFKTEIPGFEYYKLRTDDGDITAVAIPEAWLHPSKQ